MLKLNLLPVVGPASQAEVYYKPSIIDLNMYLNWLTDSNSKFRGDYEHRHDIWHSLLQQEAEKPRIHLRSPQLELRDGLVQQLRNVTQTLGLSLATLHSAVWYLDLFMDAHQLRADRITPVALACFSIAAKSEENYSQAPKLRTLRIICDVHISGKKFRQLEWMVGEHIKWRLRAPTPVTFASLLARYVVTEEDLVTRHPEFVRRFIRDGVKSLEAYLNLTLSDVRLKKEDTVDVSCACVMCARAELGLIPWSNRLAAVSGRMYTRIHPLAQRLRRMMKGPEWFETSVDSEDDQGYGSARTSPKLPRWTSPGTLERHLDTNAEFAYKRYRLATHISPVFL